MTLVSDTPLVPHYVSILTDPVKVYPPYDSLLRDQFNALISILKAGYPEAHGPRHVHQTKLYYRVST